MYVVYDMRGVTQEPEYRCKSVLWEKQIPPNLQPKTSSFSLSTGTHVLWSVDTFFGSLSTHSFIDETSQRHHHHVGGFPYLDPSRGASVWAGTYIWGTMGEKYSLLGRVGFFVPYNWKDSST
jgi:hypothetical protein